MRGRRITESRIPHFFFIFPQTSKPACSGFETSKSTQAISLPPHPLPLPLPPIALQNICRRFAPRHAHFSGFLHHKFQKNGFLDSKFLRNSFYVALSLSLFHLLHCKMFAADLCAHFQTNILTFSRCSLQKIYATNAHLSTPPLPHPPPFPTTTSVHLRTMKEGETFCA